MSDELIDICDEKNNLLNQKKMKSEAHRLGLWHRASHIWIYNSKGEILLQLRSKEKSLYPNLWDVSVAGHVSSGEDPLISALRELKEEIGLVVKKEDLTFLKIIKKKMAYKDILNNEFYYIYLLKFDGDISKLKLQKEEVQKIKFFKIKDLKIKLKTNPQDFVPHEVNWLEMLNEIKKRFV